MNVAKIGFKPYAVFLMAICVIAIPLFAETGIKQLSDTIKQETIAILPEALATMTTANVVYSDAYATMTTANDIWADTSATVTTQKLLLRDVIATMTTANTIYIDAYTTMTTANNIKLDTHATVTTQKIIVADLQGTITTGNAVHADALATMTTLNAISFDPTDMNATLTTLNNIKIDTNAMYTNHRAIYTNVAATMATTDAVYDDLSAAGTTLYGAQLDTLATITDEQEILRRLENLSQNGFLEAQATLTTLNDIKAETAYLLANIGGINTNLSTILSTANSIYVDTQAIAPQYPPIQTQAVATNATTNLISARSSTLAVPFSGGTISSPGAYRLTGNIADGQIIIDSDNVCLMLNGFTVKSTTLNVIVIRDGHKNIYIAGGTIVGNGSSSVNACILLGNSLGGCQNITIEHIVMTESGYGVNALAGDAYVLIRDITFDRCHFPIKAVQSVGMRVRRCIMQLGDVALQPTAKGIDITGNTVVPTGALGPSIYDCTIRGFSIGMAVRYCQGAIIDRCIVGDVQLTAGAALTLYGIQVVSVSNTSIADNIISNIGLDSGTFVGQVYGLSLNSSSNCTITNGTFGWLYTSTGNAANTVYGTSYSSSPDTTVANCSVDYVSSYNSYGIMIDASSHRAIASDNVVSNLSGIAGAAFALTAGATNCVFTRNLAVNMSGAVAFSGAIPAVTSGFVGTNAIYNYSLPT